MEITLREPPPRCILILDQYTRRKFLEEYGASAISKITANFSAVDPEQKIVRVRMPVRSGDPLFPIVERGDDEPIWIAIFERVKYIPENRLLEYRFCRIEKAYVSPEEEIPPLWEIFNPPELTHVRTHF